MTNKEIVDKIKLYESKWGRLGHTNIMKPELNHSGLEGGNKMSNMTNDLIAFRQKVAAGREANKLAHKSTINVTDINKRYFEDLTSNGTLIHAGNQPLRYNVKYYKKEDLGNGKSRYYYSKEEWDAAHNNETKEEPEKREPEKESKEQGNKQRDITSETHNSQAASVKKYSEIARNGSPKAAAKAIFDNKDMGMDELLYEIEEGFKSGALKWNGSNFKPGENPDAFEETKGYVEEVSDAVAKWINNIDKDGGTGKEVKNEITKLLRDKCAEYERKYNTSATQRTKTKANFEKFGKEFKKSLNSLSHSNLNYGQKFYNKIDNYYADGRARYFWSKAEWDAYQREQQGQAQDKFKKEQAQKKTAASKEAERGNDMSGYENWKKEKVAEKTKQINNNKQADTAKKIQDIYRQGGAKAAAQEVTKTNEWKELMNVFDEVTKAGYDVRTLSNEDKKKLDPQLQKRMDNAKDDYAKLIGSNSKSRSEIHNELEKVMNDHVEKSISRRDKTSLNTATSGREAAEKAGQKETQKLQAKEKKLQENIKERDQYSDQADKIDKEIKESDKEQESKVKEKENRKKEIIQDYYKNNPDATSFSNDFNKTVDERGKSNFTVTVQPSGEMVIYAPEFDKQIKELESKYKELQKFYESDSKKLRLNDYKDEYERRELESAREYSRLLCLQAEQQLKELENKKQMFAYDEFDSVCRQMGINFDKYNLNEREGKYKSEVKHSSEEEPEIMDEYSAFMERVKRGKEKNRLAHSTLISPADLNARYEQAIKDKCFLVHSGNFKYYNKIDLGNGKSRYFYTKAEWDAYQDGLGQAKIKEDEYKSKAKQKDGMEGYESWNKERRDRLQIKQGLKDIKAKNEADKRNDMSGYAEWKKENDAKVYREQQEKTISKNKAAAEAEGDREKAKYDNLKKSFESKKLNIGVSPMDFDETSQVISKQARDTLRKTNYDKNIKSREEAEKAGQDATRKANAELKLDNDYNKAYDDYVKASQDIMKEYYSDIKSGPDFNVEDYIEDTKDLVKDIKKAAKKVDNPNNIELVIGDEGINVSVYAPGYLDRLTELANKMNLNAFDKNTEKELERLSKENAVLAYPYLTSIFNYLLD